MQNNPFAKLQVKLRPYQIQGYKKLYNNILEGCGTLLADDMGLGKTVQIIATIQTLINENKIPPNNNILLIVPKSLITNWIQEFGKFAPTVRLQRFTDIYDKSSCDVVLATYGEVFFNCKQLLKARGYILSKITSEIIQSILKKKHYMIILDEAQKIKNVNAQITKLLQNLNAKYKIAITGTPIENHIGEFASLLTFINPSLIKHFHLLQSRYEADRNKFLKIITPYVIRRLKRNKKIIKDLPDKFIRDVLCNITPMQEKYLLNVPQDVLNVLQSGNNPDSMRAYSLLYFLFVKQILNHPAGYRFGYTGKKITLKQSGKLLKLKSIIEEKPDSKFLISTQFVKMGLLLVRLLKEEMGLDSFFLQGNLSSAERLDLVKKFQDPNSTTKIFIVSAKAGGTGLNITAANVIIFLDRLWNPSTHKQIMDRLHRIGQKRDVEVMFLVNKHHVEKRTSHILQFKEELISFCLDEAKDEAILYQFSEDDESEITLL